MASPSSDEVLVALSFSGGGTRAAAFAYGVLEALREIHLGTDEQPSSLLDEVDVISSVSGGSIAAAYYALFGDRVFADFEHGFLKRNIQRELTRRTLSPRNWFRLASAHFRRIDLVAELFDEALFEHRTFGDFAAKGPFVIINATDISRGSRFDFTQGRFDLLCSNLGTYPIARAVAASAAVPVLLSPITLESFGWQACDYQGPFSHPQPSSQRLENLRSFRDPNKRRYVHLFDGGLVDNLGIQGLLDQVFSKDAPCELIDKLRLQRLRKVLVIVVNAVTELDRRADMTLRGPTLAQTIWAAANIPIDLSAASAVANLHTRLNTWAEQISACRAADGQQDPRPITIHPVVVDFNAVRDPAHRDAFKQLATTFSLPDETVDDLRAASREVVLESFELKKFLCSSGDCLSAPILRSLP